MLANLEAQRQAEAERIAAEDGEIITETGRDLIALDENPELKKVAGKLKKVLA